MGGRCCSKTQTAPSPQKTELRIRPIADQQINRITVHVVQARNLPIKDVGVMAKSDPYVKVTFQGIDGAEYRTDHIRAELNPVWYVMLSLIPHMLLIGFLIFEGMPRLSKKERSYLGKLSIFDLMFMITISFPKMNGSVDIHFQSNQNRIIHLLYNGSIC